VGSQGPGSASDEVLCHELVHALYQLRGLQRCRAATGPSQGFDIEEDILAVAIANVYSSETGRKLRKDHHLHQELTYTGFARAKEKHGLSEIFYALHEIPITRFCVYFWNCARALAKVKASFNPFAVALS
jgi:hypothetical protein